LPRESPKRFEEREGEEGPPNPTPLELGEEDSGCELLRYGERGGREAEGVGRGLAVAELPVAGEPCPPSPAVVELAIECVLSSLLAVQAVAAEVEREGSW
jgi:hypothetical protein